MKQVTIDRAFNELSTKALQKQQRFFVDNLMFDVQLADVSTRCSSHPQGKSEARCENDGDLQARLVCLHTHVVQCRG